MINKIKANMWMPLLAKEEWQRTQFPYLQTKRMYKRKRVLHHLRTKVLINQLILLASYRTEKHRGVLVAMLLMFQTCQAGLVAAL